MKFSNGEPGEVGSHVLCRIVDTGVPVGLAGLDQPHAGVQAVVQNVVSSPDPLPIHHERARGNKSNESCA